MMRAFMSDHVWSFTIVIAPYIEAHGPAPRVCMIIPKLG
jgi:hypothetical protein